MTMISSFRHLSRSPALQSSMQRHCLRRPSAVYSSPVAAPFSSFFANNGFSSTVPNAAPSTHTHAPTENGHVLTKADLAQIISAEHDLKLAQSNRILNTLLDTIVEVRVRFYLAYFFHVSCHNNIICYLTNAHIITLSHSKAVSKQGTVSISGFGKFSRKTLAAGEYRNPSTGAVVMKGERYTPKFQAFTNFKECVNGSKSVKK